MKRLAASMMLVASLVLGGCATVPPGQTATPAQKADPFEAWNRKVFAFNDVVDDAVLKPVAEGYRKLVPALVRTGVSNFFGNIGDVWSSANHFLQGKFQSGVEMGMRVIVNTTFGLAGVLDPATEMKLTRRSEDFGQTLGRWGVGPGPYLVLPLLGPSDVRDTFGFVVDRQAAASTLFREEADRYAVTALQLINTRSDLLATTDLVNDVALDRYGFIRDAYLSRRLDQVYDGAAPLENFNDEPADPAPKK